MSNNQKKDYKATEKKMIKKERNMFAKPPFPQLNQNKRAVLVPSQVILTGADGFTNPLAHIGAASPLMASGTFVRSGLTNQTDMLTTAYRESSLAKRIIDTPSEDMTRKWYTLSGSKLDEEDLCKLRDLEAKHNVKQEITNGIRWARLYGGSIAVIIIAGEEDIMDQPLKPEQLPMECFKGLCVVDQTQGITPSIELEDDLDDPDYGFPKYYEVDIEKNGKTEHIKIHHSRTLLFTGRELPTAEIQANQYWGVSELEHMWDVLTQYQTICGNIVQLMFTANLVTLKMGEFGADLAYGSDRTREAVEQAIQNENRLRTSYGVQVMNADDSIETHSYAFTGLEGIKDSFMMDIAGAAEIPATILFGRSPQGMNATGEMDIRNYYDKISQLQERMLRPVLEKLLPIMAMSCWGVIPPNLKIIFNPIMTISPAERATLSRTMTEEIIAAYQSGLITQDEARAEMRTRGNVIGSWENIT